jgi:hypothetical protein
VRPGVSREPGLAGRATARRMPTAARDEMCKANSDRSVQRLLLRGQKWALCGVGLVDMALTGRNVMALARFCM